MDNLLKRLEQLAPIYNFKVTKNSKKAGIFYYKNGKRKKLKFKNMHQGEKDE